MSQKTENLVSDDLQATLDRIAAAAADRKDEIVDLLSSEQPKKSRQIDAVFNRCIWWEGCYYCQDELGQWQRVKCFM
ncbi:MAG: hypothetical protein Fur0046_06860 [Cyanobacteria bacterium J069]|nr:MAG: hypothetical protein D6742_07960 [Cyanobacteria bacterium J069]